MALQGYVLISYGPRPGRSLLDCEAAERQLRMLRYLAANHEVKLVTIHDYCRKVRALKDLPNLKKALGKMKEMGQGAISVLCLNELVHKVDLGRRQDFIDELLEYGDVLFCLRVGKLLRSFSEAELRELKLIKKPMARIAPPKGRVSEEHRKSAGKASEASRIARKQRSSRSGELLAKIREEFKQQGRPNTLQHIADEANRRGLLTQRGSAWSMATVSYQLRKLDQASK